ncbi:hypothetical protein AKJ48_00255 [candidate division MSBL1 archaeon SCGC-AAA261O19]|uniref:PIN domain-containing protein n=1 Tax=candidate division MSBL1 archaeon SCGC-AAA261O19 TaxID=1698277 RepID=A0A133VFA2_9EURY|nr:hypothetical protein AKJ48_00255 [candidate division MSBL1 archaeon SCGC-AAA261O19]
MKIPERIMIDADLFISYLTEDELTPKFSKVVERANRGEVKLLATSELYDDVISALRSQKIGLDKILDFLSDMRAIPHESIPVTIGIARKALHLYSQHKGSRKLHYFDSFHVAAAGQQDLPLLTSDKYIIKHTTDLGIGVINAREL